jgi:hypothetical protein
MPGDRLARMQGDETARIQFVRVLRAVDVGFDDLVSRPDRHHLPVPEHQDAMAQAADRRHVVADEEDGAAAAGDILHRAEAFALERDVAHGEDLVDQQDFGPQMGGDGEGEAHLHAGAVALDGRVHEGFQSRELHDPAVLLADLPLAQAQDGAVEEDVLAAGQLGMEAGADFQQRGDSPAQDGLSGGRVGDARQDLEQRALAGAVGADDAEDLSLRPQRS